MAPGGRGGAGDGHDGADVFDARLDTLRDLPPPPPPPLPADLEEELASLAPVAPRRPWRQLALVAAVSIGYAGLIVALISLRKDLPGLPRGWMAAYLAAWLAGFGAPLALAVVPARGSMMPRTNLAAAVAAVAAIGFVALGLLWAHHGPDSHVGGLRAAPGCLSIGLVTALVPVVLGTMLLRGAAPVGSRLTAAALGASAGSLGGFVLHLHCPIADRLHVGLVHGGVVAIAAVLTAALAARPLEPRR
ncbi:MAG TPA: NrsF family protein [Kofleriaceae bacterium]|nr:NrsF family protein [Kofleriaceae bacterium]